MRQPIVSIVTPSFNQGEFIEDTILSVVEQDYEHIEYIIIDGGSTDNTISILKKYENKLAKWISEPDQGQSDAINKGWRLATGEIIAWLNSDDMYMPNVVNAIVETFMSNPEAGLVYGDALKIDRAGNVLGSVQPLGYIGRAISSFTSYIPFNIPQPAGFLRSDLVKKAGYLDINLHYAMDYDLFLRVSKMSKVIHLRRIIARMRLYMGTKSSRSIEENMQEKFNVLRKYDSLWFLSPYWFRYLRFHFWQMLPNSSQRYIRRLRRLPRDYVFLNDSPENDQERI